MFTYIYAIERKIHNRKSLIVLMFFYHISEKWKRQMLESIF